MKRTKVIAALLISTSFFIQAQDDRNEALFQRQQNRLIKAQEELEKKAKELNIPIRYYNGDGELVSLSAIENNKPFYTTVSNTISIATTNATEVKTGGSSNLDLSGQDIVVGVWDGGAQRNTHVEFDNRTQFLDGTVPLSNHATHVTGTILANGTRANAEGFAPNATAQNYDFDNDLTEISTAGWNGLRLSNHSYGLGLGWEQDATGSWVNNGITEGFGKYTNLSRELDITANQSRYYLMVMAAGNDRNDAGDGSSTSDFNLESGYDLIAPRGCAKNNLTVGSIKDLPNGYTGNPNDVISSDFSSWGPADDGRIKPDISANGDGLTSASSSGNTSYVNMSGTSMSAPSVTGGLALLMEHQQNLNSDEWLSSTYKGLVLHTADEAGPNDGPDYRFGWGVMNVESAVNLISEDANAGGCSLIKEIAFQSDETIEFQIRKNNLEDLKVTMAWIDQAGSSNWLSSTESRTPSLVRDLDLRISDMNGTEHFPWVLDPDNPSAAAIKGNNLVDNVEQVVVSDNNAGLYTVSIRSKNSFWGDQIVSVIISGVEPIEENITLIGNNAAKDFSFLATNDIELKNNYSLSSGQVRLYEAGSSITVSPNAVLKFGSEANLVIGTNDLQCDFGNVTPPPSIQPVVSQNENNSKVQENSSTTSYENTELMLFPNPVKSTFTIQGQESIQSLNLYSSSGKLVLEQKNWPTINVVDVSHLPSGIYYVNIITNDNKKSTHKLSIIK